MVKGLLKKIEFNKSWKSWIKNNDDFSNSIKSGNLSKKEVQKIVSYGESALTAGEKTLKLSKAYGYEISDVKFEQSLDGVRKMLSYYQEQLNKFRL